MIQQLSSSGLNTLSFKVKRIQIYSYDCELWLYFPLKMLLDYFIKVRINLPLFSTVVPSSIVENNGKLILTEIFPSVQKHYI